MHVFDVSEFGARADGRTLSTRAIQEAIDACHGGGGGRVVCGPGVWVSGTLTLRSHVELHLTAGCTLRGSTELGDYADLEAPGFDSARPPERSSKSLIRAIEAEGIAITGAGTIDGAGLAFYDLDQAGENGKLPKPPRPRPRGVMFYRCRDVRIEDATFVDAPCWTLWLMQCARVQVHRVKVRGDRRMRNNDGIDIDGCRDVTVSDCVFNTEDDCVVLRAMQRLYDTEAICENVVVSNCVLESGCQGVRVGCPGDGTVRDCTLTNLVIHSTGNGIVFDNPHRYLPEGRPGSARVHDIQFSNVVMRCARTPIKISVEDGIELPRLGGLRFADFRIQSGEPCRVTGNAQTRIRDVHFSGVRIETAGEDAIICRHCEGVRLDDVELTSA